MVLARDIAPRERTPPACSADRLRRVGGVTAPGTSSISTNVCGRAASLMYSTKMPVTRWIISAFCALYGTACGSLMLAKGMMALRESWQRELASVATCLGRELI